MTLGVRGLVVDERNRVLLVRHTYVEGFYLPGGGVESGETLVEALERELSEEANVLLDAPPELFGMYFNRRFSMRDHVALYVARAFRITEPRAPDREIAEAGFLRARRSASGYDRRDAGAAVRGAGEHACLTLLVNA